MLPEARRAVPAFAAAGNGGGAGWRADSVPMAWTEPRSDGRRTDGPGQRRRWRGRRSPAIREYFPETLLWQPALITDDKGKATLKVPFADSITTWRLTASASSKGGSLGGMTTPLRVFQDFFVDLDLPLALTQNDEVAFPVAVYNYLKEKQTVTARTARRNPGSSCSMAAA